jgi:hypothetical protein
MARRTRIIKIGSVKIKAAFLKLFALVRCNINPPQTNWCVFLPQTSPDLFFFMRTTDAVGFLNEQRYDLKHTVLDLCPQFVRFFALTPPANLHQFLICAHFWFNVLWLAAF